MIFGKLNKSLCSAVLLLSLTACGIVSIGYNYADVYLRYTVNRYATFNEAQKREISREVDEYMKWHRREMLPAYVAFLKKLQEFEVSGRKLTAMEVAVLRSDLRALYINTLQPTVRPAARILGSADEGQIAEMQAAMAKENEKQRDKELSGSQDEQLRKRAERTVDFVESLTGDLNDRQLDKVREMSRALPYATALYIKLREDNQARLMALLKDGKDEKELADFLMAWLLVPELSRSQEEQRLLTDFERASESMVADIYQLLSERQKKTWLKNIEKYIGTLEGLSIQNM